MTVKLGLVKLLQKRFDICQEAWVLTISSFLFANRFLMLKRSREADATVRCPVAPGSHTIEQKVKLPKEIPKGMESDAGLP